MQWLGGAAVAQSLPQALPAAVASPAATPRKWPIEEGPDTPKLCLLPGDGGGPLPVTVPPELPGTPRRMGGEAFGGYLAPGTEPAPTPVGTPTAERGGFGRNLGASYRRIRQLGVTHVANIYAGDWTEESIRAAIQAAKEHDLVAYNAMMGIPSSIIYGKPDRANDLEKVIGRIQAAGKAGLPVIEYNFYAHRATEGYYETVGRAWAGYTGFDYELDVLVDDQNRMVGPIYRDAHGQITPETVAAFPNAKRIKVKDLPPLPSEGAHNLDEMWANITYFLKAAVPAAEKAGVRLALHPNDPPAPISRGSQQIMGTVAGWKHLISIVDSPSNGITFDCGVTREMGENPVEVAEYFASRKRINHMHYRNVLVVKPYEKYQEVFIDAGMGDMFGVMKAVVRNKYTGTIYPEHPRALDADRDRVPAGGRLPGYPGGGGYDGYTFSVAYARAMMQAALESV
jgi:mannonate dehydratase